MYFQNNKSQLLHKEREAEMRRLRNQRRSSEDPAAKIWSAAEKTTAFLISPHYGNNLSADNGEWLKKLFFLGLFLSRKIQPILDFRWAPMDNSKGHKMHYFGF